MSQAQPPIPETPAEKRQYFDPIDGPATWMDFFEELTWGYMQREDQAWVAPGPHHERLFADFETGNHLIRLAHRRSLKTTAALAYIIAQLEFRSGIHVGWIGNNETLAYEKAHSEFDKLVERNPWLTTLQEHNRTTDQKGKKAFGNDSDLTVGWLFGGIEGVGVDVLVVDDLVKEKGDGDMQAIEDWLSSVIFPIQEEGGQTIIIGTRKSSTDLYSLLDKRDGFDFTDYPAVLDEWESHFGDEASHRRPDPELYHTAEHPFDESREAQILWDQRSTEYLRDFWTKQSEHTWMREFCLVVQTREGAVYDVFDRDRHVTHDDPADVELWFNSVDWGSGNPAGFLQWAVTDEGLVVVDEEKYPAGGTQDYVDTLTTMASTWGRGPVACDPSDKRGIDDLRKEGFDAVSADNDIHAGIRTAKDHFVAGELTIHDRCEQLRAELGAYRYNQTTGKPVDKNDHLADSLRYGIMTFQDIFQHYNKTDADDSGVSFL